MSNGRTREQMSEDMKAYWRRRKAVRIDMITPVASPFMDYLGSTSFRYDDGKHERT